MDYIGHLIYTLKKFKQTGSNECCKNQMHMLTNYNKANKISLAPVTGDGKQNAQKRAIQEMSAELKMLKNKIKERDSLLEQKIEEIESINDDLQHQVSLNRSLKDAFGKYEI